MRNNQPVTTVEIPCGTTPDRFKTDLKGRITYINRDFLEISGFSEAELLGEPHNIVRHPDMPAEAFQDLWDDLRLGALGRLRQNRARTATTTGSRPTPRPSGKTARSPATCRCAANPSAPRSKRPRAPIAGSAGARPAACGSATAGSPGRRPWPGWRGLARHLHRQQADGRLRGGCLVVLAIGTSVLADRLTATLAAAAGEPTWRGVAWPEAGRNQPGGHPARSGPAQRRPRRLFSRRNHPRRQRRGAGAAPRRPRHRQ